MNNFIGDLTIKDTISTDLSKNCKTCAYESQSKHFSKCLYCKINPNHQLNWRQKERNKKKVKKEIDAQINNFNGAISINFDLHSLKKYFKSNKENHVMAKIIFEMEE